LEKLGYGQGIQLILKGISCRESEQCKREKRHTTLIILKIGQFLRPITVKKTTRLNSLKQIIFSPSPNKDRSHHTIAAATEPTAKGQALSYSSCTHQPLASLTAMPGFLVWLHWGIAELYSAA
jgi:hypothetical protein